MNLAGKTFRAVSNTASGAVSSETAMSFETDDGVAAGSYAGGAVKVGHVLARHGERDRLELLYHGATADGDIRAGKAQGRLEYDEDGRLQMILSWQWLTGDKATGHSRWLLEPPAEEDAEP